MKRLLEIQQELKVAKDQFNSFGNYKYRSCEQILEALKPLLKKNELVLTLTDEIVQLGARFYVKAVATLYDLEGKEIHHVIGMAREQENKKGMDESQVTGATSSYARKYALNGLFCIDDQKDPDNNDKENDNEEEKEKETNKKPICPKCGNETSQGAINNWGICAKCYKESKNA